MKGWDRGWKGKDSLCWSWVVVEYFDTQGHDCAYIGCLILISHSFINICKTTMSMTCCNLVLRFRKVPRRPWRAQSSTTVAGLVLSLALNSALPYNNRQVFQSWQCQYSLCQSHARLNVEAVRLLIFSRLSHTLQCRCYISPDNAGLEVL